MELRVKRAPRFDAEITVPGDKSISHRAAIITALQGLLGVPLEVGRGGLREGVLLELLDRLSLPAVQSV